MELPQKGTAARAIFELLHSVGPLPREEIIASIPAHEEKTLIKSVADLTKDRRLHKDDEGYHLGFTVTAEFDRLAGKNQPVVAPPYHNCWTPPMRGYEAAMRRGVRS